MISKIHIQNIATINDLTIEPLRINYIFGGNGSGKTTISKFLSSEANYQNGSILRDDTHDILVYNKDFVDNNFQDKNAINGIFTIGESAVEVLKFIEEQEAEKSKYQKELTARMKSLEGLQDQIDSLQSTLEDNCWEAQKEIGASMPLAITGTRNNKKIFTKKCLDCYNGQKANYIFDELLKNYQKVFQSSAQEYAKVDHFKFSIINHDKKITLSEIESDPIFIKKLVKSSESNFSKFIDSLGNVDWVSQGLKWLKSSEKCPFCQRVLTKEILSELNHLFDESYNSAIDSITSFEQFYLDIASGFDVYYKDKIKFLESIRFIELTSLEQKYNKLKAKINQNIVLIREKLSHPSSEIVLGDSNPEILAFISEIDNINKQIDQNNEYVKDLKNARTQLSDKVWDYISNCRLFSIIEQYKKELAGKNQGVLKLKMSIDSFRLEIENCNKIIREKRATAVCIDNAINDINTLLLGFGFKGFKVPFTN